MKLYVRRLHKQTDNLVELNFSTKPTYSEVKQKSVTAFRLQNAEGEFKLLTNVRERLSKHYEVFKKDRVEESMFYLKPTKNVKPDFAKKAEKPSFSLQATGLRYRHDRNGWIIKDENGHSFKDGNGQELIFDSEESAILHKYL